MPPDEAPAPEETQDTPQAPESGPVQDGTPAESPEDSQGTNWQERYQNLQPEYTRATQEAAQLREIIDLVQQGDPETLQALGLDLADAEDDEAEFEDDPDARLDALEQYLSQQAEAQAQAEEEAALQDAVEEHLAGQLQELESKHGTLDDKLAERLLQLAEALPDENGFPDLAAAYDEYKQWVEDERQNWVKSKRAPQVQSGSPSSHQPDLDDPEQRREYMAQLLRDAEAPSV